VTFRIKDGTEVVAATYGPYERELLVAEEISCSKRLWLASNEHGVLAVAEADSFEDAWAAVIDVMPPIDVDELPEAYGFYGPTARLDFRRAVALAQEDEGEWPELQEGYERQQVEGVPRRERGEIVPNTGIVDVGHHLTIREMTRGDLENIHLKIGSY
jgi:hypothetical protein